MFLALLATASAYTYYTREALLEAFFPGADSIESHLFSPPASVAAELGYALPKSSYEVLVAIEAGAPIAYALIDEQVGQHEPITYAVLFDTAGTVQRVEVMVYREAYGDGVRSENFRRQFSGKNADSSLKLGRDIQVVSGATLSSRALTVGIRRDTVLLEAWLAGGS
jgi:Na+-translocating ferredoxin:NAD+ oxidoreductase RnfG subunit